MVRNVDAIYDQGVFRPIEPSTLPDGARVHLLVEEENGGEPTAVKSAAGELPTLLERLKGFVGVIDDLPEDSSTNLDHYLRC